VVLNAAVLVYCWWYNNQATDRLLFEGRRLLGEMSMVELARRWGISMEEVWRDV
jgi:hypothetical protein